MFSKSTRPSILAGALLLNALSAQAHAAPAGTLIQCTYKAEEAKELCSGDRGTFEPCEMSTLRVEHSAGGTVLAALGTHKPGTARLLKKNSGTYTYTWKNIWSDGIQVELADSATAWNEFTIPTADCRTRRTTLSLNVKNPAQSSVTFDETERQCGGMSFLSPQEKSFTHSERQATCTIVSPIQPWTPTPVVPHVKQPVPASVTTQTGSLFTNVTAQYPQLGEAWQAPNGVIWGAIVQKGGRIGTQYGPGVNEDSKVLPYCNNKDSYAGDCWTSSAKAAAYCQSIGAHLPSIEEFKQLAVYMGSGSDPKRSMQGYYPQVFTGLMDVFTLASSDPTLGFAACINQFSKPTESEDKQMMAVRCVLSAAQR